MQQSGGGRARGAYKQESKEKRVSTVICRRLTAGRCCVPAAAACGLLLRAGAAPATHGALGLQASSPPPASCAADPPPPCDLFSCKVKIVGERRGRYYVHKCSLKCQREAGFSLLP